MKKIISLLLAMVFMLLSLVAFASCNSDKDSETEMQYKSIVLTKNNVYDYISVRTFYENFECDRQPNSFFGSEYDWSMMCNIQIKGKNADYIFDNVTIKVTITTTPFSISNLDIMLDENGKYEDVFYCFGTEYTEPNSARVQVSDLIYEVSGSVRIPE